MSPDMADAVLKIAEMTGQSVETIFPWFVERSVAAGQIFLVVGALMMIASVAFVAYTRHVLRHEETFYGDAAIMSCAGAVISGIVSIAFLANAFFILSSPEAAAVKSILDSVTGG